MFPRIAPYLDAHPSAARRSAGEQKRDGEELRARDRAAKMTNAGEVEGEVEGEVGEKCFST